MSIINKQTEVEVLLCLNNHVEEAQIALHTEYTLGNYEHTTTLRLSQLGCVLELQAQRLLVVVSIYETLALVHTQTIDDAGVALGVVNHNVAGRKQAVDNRDHTLITEVQKESVLLTNELCELALQLLVVLGLTTHHTSTHRGCHTKLLCTSCVGLTHLGVVSQTEVVVQTPVEHHLTAKTHMGTKLALQLGECKITVHQLHILTNRATGVLL